MSYCFLIPCYNHGTTLSSTLASLKDFALPVIVVDDGSTPEQASLIQQACDEFDFVSLQVKENNSGKGGAVITGMLLALKQGFSHIIQVDADGQHNINDVPKLIAKSKEQPDALISGRPVYDASIPKARLYGRYLTHVWVWIETLSFNIADSMCGFRVYPLASCQKLLRRTKLGRYMDFDTEVLVRLYWQGVPMTFIPTQVIYPEDGTSNFRALQDNVLISWMHTRLFFGMLVRSPLLLSRKLFSNIHYEK
jgi:glycosyltransferase involved in cell wall biosynthesis